MTNPAGGNLNTEKFRGQEPDTRADGFYCCGFERLEL
jgi:hypothetical protein